MKIFNKLAECKQWIIRIVRRSALLDMWYCRVFYKKDCFRMVFGGVLKHNDILQFPGQYQDMGWLNGTQYRYLHNGWVVRHYA